MKKKTIVRITVLSLILALAGILLAGVGLLLQPEDQSRQVEELYLENQALKEQMEALEGQLERFMTLSSLKSWELNAVAWADSTGADVTLTAVPTEYQPGMGATLLVMLGERQAASVPCVWDGTVFRGTASLNASDGYSYFCLLSGPTGVQQLSLMDPNSENADIPVFLQSSLSSYCNLVIHDWEELSGTSVTLTGAYAQVQLPRIHSGELTIATQDLVLRLNGQVSAKVPVVLTPSEVEGSFELSIEELHFPMPVLTANDNLELMLEITLSDGRHLQAFGIGWYLENGKLCSSVG
jgi:hypothetical protein